MSDMPKMSDVYDDVSRIIASADADNLPEIMQCSPRDAARWWIQVVMEPHGGGEYPEKRKVHGGEDYRWHWPYRVRVVSCLEKFLTVTHDFQRFIIAAAEDGIHWRGDGEQMFQAIVEEVERMREIGAGRYRTETIRKMRNFRLGEGKIEDCSENHGVNTRQASQDRS